MSVSLQALWDEVDTSNMQDGVYTALCESAQRDFTKRERRPIFIIHYTIADGVFEGGIIEDTLFLDTQLTVNRLKGIGLKLGMPESMFVKGANAEMAIDEISKKLYGGLYEVRQETTLSANGKAYKNYYLHAVIAKDQPVPSVPQVTSQQAIAQEAPF